VICFADNDILHKLAAFALWEEARAVLTVGPKQVLLLPTAPFVLGLKDPATAVNRHGTALASRLQKTVAASGTVEESPAVEDQVALAGVLGIDQGEAILIALASRSPPSVLLTGDKRSLRALATEPTCAPIVEHLAGRVVVLEQVVRAIVSTYPFEIIRDKVVPAVAVDTAIRAVWGSGALAKRADVLAGLEAYIQDLRGQTGGLLRTYDDW
jgi:hypothetical protein